MYPDDVGPACDERHPARDVHEVEAVPEQPQRAADEERRPPETQRAPRRRNAAPFDEIPERRRQPGGDDREVELAAAAPDDLGEDPRRALRLGNVPGDERDARAASDGRAQAGSRSGSPARPAMSPTSSAAAVAPRSVSRGSPAGVRSREAPGARSAQASSVWFPSRPLPAP